MVEQKKIAVSERNIVEGIIKDAIGWALTKDKERLFKIMTQEDDFFIFHPDSKSTIQGFAPFKNMAEKSWMSPDFRATDFAVKDLRIVFSRSNTVAWFSAYLDDHAEYKGQKIGWDNARWTGVLEKRQGSWVIVQMHFSFAKE